jgi:DNA-binding NarL/FixJ family response regulator
VLNGPSVIQVLRMPGEFAKPFLPIIMLMSRPSRSQVHDAMRVGVHAVVATPTSPKILQDHLLFLLVNPRPALQVGSYFVPEPRQGAQPGDPLTTTAEKRAQEPMAGSPSTLDSRPLWTPLPRRSRQPQFHLFPAG